ncbi:MAG: HAMP domain-containing protein [Desulfuromonadales bacterium]|nr:HAMP domain-containing protein [Desulfuromonadales bacterium]
MPKLKLSNTQGVPDTESRKRRREWLLVVVITGLVALSLRYQGQLFDLTSEIPLSGNILVLALINLNILLIIFCLFLVMRNIFKLLLERRRGIPGAKLRSKLVLAFIALSLIPTMLLFFVSAGFITNSIENWFNSQIEKSLEESLEVAQTYYKNSASNALYYADQISQAVKEQKLLNEDNLPVLEELIHQKQKEYNLGIVEVFSATLEELVRAVNPSVPVAEFTDPDSDRIREAMQGNRFTLISPIGRSDLIRGIVPIYSNWNPNDVVGVVVVNYYVPYSLVNKMKEISNSFEQYKSTKLLKGKIQKGYVLFLLLIALVIIFLSTWAGFHLARSITEPIHDLAVATNRVASGDLNVTLDSHSNDEVGSLMEAFNTMTADLRTGQKAIRKANRELQASNLELEQRRRYMEIVLANVTAGVISIDSRGHITTINKSAQKLLNLNTVKVIGRNFRDIVSTDYLPMIKGILKELISSGKDSIRKQITLPTGDTKVILLVNVTTLKDENNEFMGTVVVFDDLTQLLKAQRMAAWREVARRIAHEIKNPLTPIQLSAQRLRRRYLDKFDADDTVFDECTAMVIKQVDDLKNLVNEFSSFARMPASNPSLNNLNDVLNEALVLFQEGHKEIDFQLQIDSSLPAFSLDREQIKRAIINLLDNAVAAVNGSGQIVLKTSFNKDLKIATLKVSDNGCGIPAEDKPRLFEPYFSTKKSGTGLGLAIVSTIISDHNGYIRVRDNEPQGTHFIVELPITSEVAQA